MDIFCFVCCKVEELWQPTDQTLYNSNVCEYRVSWPIKTQNQNQNQSAKRGQDGASGHCATVRAEPTGHGYSRRGQREVEEESWENLLCCLLPPFSTHLPLFYTLTFALALDPVSVISLALSCVSWKSSSTKSTKESKSWFWKLFWNLVMSCTLM